MYTNTIKFKSLAIAEPKLPYNLPTYKWIDVLVDCPGRTELFTYKLPSELTVKPGDILTVPFGAQKVGGVAIRLVMESDIKIPPEKIKEVEDVVSEGFFSETYCELLSRVANYYYTPLIQVIRAALPPGLLGRSQRRIRLIKEAKIKESERFISLVAQQVLEVLQTQPSGDYSFAYIQQKVRGAYRGVRELLRLELVESYLETPTKNRPKLQKAVTLTGVVNDNLTPIQQEILEVLRRQGGELWQSDLLRTCKTSSSTLKTMAEKGYVVISDKEILRLERGITLDQDQPKCLNPAQSRALDTIQDLKGFTQVLLHGITGSGKTEVYLQAIAPLLSRGKSALILVPEIGLTPQLTDRFRARFGSKVSVYHSGLSKGERYDTWRQMLTGGAQIVIGTRSAIFAPLPNLGLIILDEEHDGSFKQDSSIPTYHARTVAQWRGELENCPVVLGSATPSLESWVSFHEESGATHRRNKNNYYVSLPERIYSRPLPPVELVDMRLELQQGNRSIFSKSLQAALRQLQERQQQGILFIHRRGHSTFVSCRSCGYVMECPHCDVSLSYHHTEETAPELLRCHYCNYTKSHPQQCPECSSPYLKFFGSGSQRVGQELTRQFPQLSFIRFDSDTTRNKDAHRNLLTRFAKGEAHLLVGTQMLTKGLDLPQVTLVGVVAADGLLNLSDYRASERAFQTLTQVAGRAGRGDDPGRVIIQTYTPQHPVIQAVEQHDYQSFCVSELEQRQSLNYPPYGRLILLRLSGLDAIEVQNTAQVVASLLAEREGFEILGPAPANVLRVADRYRWQILLKFTPDVLPELPNWELVRSLCPQTVSITIDVDPINMG